ncbi:MAG: hypothetical protein KBT28_02200 [Bacteroidales bacterium]|nr:hypothetical protein [Candidatus Colimorpha merdihippi]
MADKKVEFEIKVIGDAVERLCQITGQAEELGGTADRVKSRLTAIGGAFVAANQAFEFIKKGIDKMREYTDANRAQQEAGDEDVRYWKRKITENLARVGIKTKGVVIDNGQIEIKH